MTIKPDVKAMARHFAGASPAFAKLIQAVDIAEGDLVKAVQCTYKEVTTREQALDITCRSAVHALADYIAQHGSSSFVRFWGARWAPIGAKNDPAGLNANWTRNVQKLWSSSHA
jgi:hypothetical protein